jgi:hypothetical protein
MSMPIDRKFRLPRIWSNDELRKCAHLFEGDVVNVSGWKDEDKQGGNYRSYFKNASSYTITNYKPETRGFQGKEGEIFLDLTKPLDIELKSKFDVVFCHTVLEHVFELGQAFSNLCDMSKEAVILVVPFLQQMHADYGDYWRFTPSAIHMMFEKHGFHSLYISFNTHPRSSVYVFAIAVRDLNKWSKIIKPKLDYLDPIDPEDGFEPYAGCHALESKLHYYLRITQLKKMIKYLRVWKLR